MEFALTVAGSDPVSGAGIQADLKTFFKLKVPALSVITAITSQNSKGVYSIFPVPEKEIEAQLFAIFKEFKIKVLKIGMLPNVNTIKILSNFFKDKKIFIVLDPILKSTSGSNLYLEDTIEAIKNFLIPISNFVTPNLYEANKICNENVEDTLKLSKEFYNRFNVPVLVKGGHQKGKFLKDVFFDGKIFKVFKWKKLSGKFHGTGCILSSAITAFYFKGNDLKKSVEKGLNFLHGEMKKGKKIKGVSFKLLL